MLADLLAEFGRNCAAQFDRQVGNAAACVKNGWLDDRSRWAGVNAQAAVSAQIRWRCFPGIERHSKIEGGQDHTEEEPRTQVFINEAGVLRQPSKPRIFRGDAFD